MRLSLESDPRRQDLAPKKRVPCPYISSQCECLKLADIVTRVGEEHLARPRTVNERSAGGARYVRAIALSRLLGSTDKVMATNATKVSTALAACEYSHCCRAVSKSSGVTVQLLLANVHWIGEHPKDHLRGGDAEECGEGQYICGAIHTYHKGVRQEEEECGDDRYAKKGPARTRIDLLYGHVLGH